MKKTSQEIMNGCGKEKRSTVINGFIFCGKEYLCPICQAQRQERLECYKKELGFLEVYEKAHFPYKHLLEDIRKRISFLKSEIKILEKK